MTILASSEDGTPGNSSVCFQGRQPWKFGINVRRSIGAHCILLGLVQSTVNTTFHPKVPPRISVIMSVLRPFRATDMFKFNNV